MNELIQWLNVNQGAVMVLLNLSYVIITVFLFLSNSKMRKQNLMLELLGRRVSIYTNVRKFMSKVLTDCNCSNDELQQYLRDTRETKLLFGKDVAYFVDEIYKRGVRLASVSFKLNAFGGDRKELDSMQDGIMDWFGQQMRDPVSVFDKYIDINKMGF